MDEINYNAMRIRLDLLFRIIAQVNTMAHVRKHNKEFHDEIISLVGTSGTFQVFKLRIDNKFRYDHDEYHNSYCIGQVIANHFMQWTVRIRGRLLNEIPMFRPSIEEAMITECIDELMITLAGLLVDQRKEAVRDKQ